MVSERVLLSYKNDIDIKCIRPATVCGLSERLRLDLTVNKLTFDGFYKNKIVVNGGDQIRPNVNIRDLIRAIDHFIFARKTFKHNIYNVGFENFSILKIAEKIKKKTGAKIIIKKIMDIRSYRQDSSRLIKTGFKPKFNIDYAIDELINYFNLKRKNDFGDRNYNLIKMKQLNVQ